MKISNSVIAPIIIPDVAEVKAVANKLHTRRQAWKGEILGWQAEYTPERPEAPPILK